MNYGLYLSAAGALSNLHRQDILTNNLANANTVGFKADDIALRTRLPERLDPASPFGVADANLLLEQLGGGTFSAPTRIAFQQGALAETRSELDLAIQGDGFLVVNTGKGGSDAESLRFTRDGRLTLNSEGELVMAATGMQVLDTNDRPIHINPGEKVRIDSAGNVIQNGNAIAQLQLSTVADKSRITKEGNNLMRFAGDRAKRQPATGSLKQGFVESSALDPIVAMNAMINVSKALQANAQMMQYHDNVLGQAVNTFGRVA